jgi:hypothetical protein
MKKYFNFFLVIFFILSTDISLASHSKFFCTFSFRGKELLSANQDTPSFLLTGKHITLVKRLRNFNYSAVYSAVIDGKKMVIRFRFDDGKEIAKTEKIARIFSEAEFGVRIVGRVVEAPISVVRILGITETRNEGSDLLVDSIGAVEVLEYVEGIEYKHDNIMNNTVPISENTINRSLIYNQLKEFLEFCNTHRIQIGDDFQYFVTADSRLVVFDYDLYRLSPADINITEENANTMQKSLDYWADTVHSEWMRRIHRLEF